MELIHKERNLHTKDFSFETLLVKNILKLDCDTPQRAILLGSLIHNMKVKSSPAAQRYESTLLHTDFTNPSR